MNLYQISYSLRDAFQVLVRLYLSSKHLDGNQLILLLGYEFVSDNLFTYLCVYEVFISRLRESKGYSDSRLSPRFACFISHM